MISYTDAEYTQHVAAYDTKRRTEWTRAETDCLFDLCDRFQLKFIVIADRYLDELRLSVPQGIDRSVDELKDRYYTVSRILLAARG